MFWKQKRSIKNYNLKTSFDEIKKQARILIIDDDSDAFPYELLKKEGYDVDYWPKVDKLTDLESGRYDLIVLDISGVADQAVSQNDGAGILTHLKNHNPAQLIIAYSGQKHDLSQSAFFKQADDMLGKPSDLITCKEKIDTLLRNNFTPQYYWSQIETILTDNGISQRQLKKLEKQILCSKETNTPISIDEIRDLISLANSTTATILTLAQTIVRLISIAS